MHIIKEEKGKWKGAYTMKNIENGLQQIKEQSDNVLSAIRVFGYAVEFLNHMSEISDERKLAVIGRNIVEGMECLVDYQQKIIGQIDELVKVAGQA